VGAGGLCNVAIAVGVVSEMPSGSWRHLEFGPVPTFCTRLSLSDGAAVGVVAAGICVDSVGASLPAENHDTRGRAQVKGARVGVAASAKNAVGIGPAVWQWCPARSTPIDWRAGKHTPIPSRYPYG
jgi:hypothetical protein